MNTEHDWTVWWHDEGSGMRPLKGQDHESHVRDMTRIAWLNGAFDAADKIERLRAERDEIAEERRHAVASLAEELDRVRAQRDAALLDAEALRPIASAQWNSYSLAGLYMAERDRARRWVCELQCDPPERFIGLPHELARLKGWDCFDVTECRQPDATTDETSQDKGTA